MQDFSLNILIVEDDITLALDLMMLVEEIGYQVIGKTDNSTDALHIIKTKSPDLVLMDIEINGNLSGIQVAEKIRNTEIPVLFITGFDDDEHYERARLTNNIGYLIKPVNKFTLRAAIETAFRKIAKDDKKEETFSHKDSLFLKKKGILHRVKISTIQAVSADDNYIIIHTNQGKFYSPIRLFEMSELLKPFNFYKVHRSHIVNLDKITEMDINKNILTVGEQEIPVSRSNKQTIIDKLQNS